MRSSQTRGRDWPCLGGAFGADRGEDALAEALGYAWEHFGALAARGNPVVYLYRVGESRTRSRRRRAVLPMPVTIGLSAIEPALVGAVAVSASAGGCVWCSP